jgi:hypothetical protein
VGAIPKVTIRRSGRGIPASLPKRLGLGDEVVGCKHQNERLPL